MKEQDRPDASRAAMKQRALERWENEGGEIPDDPARPPGESDGEIGLTTREMNHGDTEGTEGGYLSDPKP